MQMQTQPKTPARPVVYKFLNGVDDTELRKWEEFMESKLYAFLITHMEKDINRITRAIISPPKDLPGIEVLRWAQGEVKGTSKFRAFFEAVKNERIQRANRSIVERAGGEQE